MKFTIVGTGVIGTTYGWQLSNAGHEVVHWVRNPTQRDTISSEGIPIRCLDLRSRRATEIETVYRPPGEYGSPIESKDDCVRPYPLRLGRRVHRRTS